MCAKLKNLIAFVIFFMLASSLLLTSCSQKTQTASFNQGWKFLLTEQEKTIQEIQNENTWRGVDIPHDWSVEFPFDSINGEGCTGYLPGGRGWYKKEFNVQLEKDKKLYVYFDGVYNHSEYWLNGKKLGYQAYGYSPFYFDITEYVKNGKNELIVKVDRTRTADSRWYTGSGIYRDVKLIYKDKLQIPVWGTFITTPEVSSEKATINLDVDIINEYATPQSFDIIAEITDDKGNSVQKFKKENIEQIKKKSTYSLKTSIDNPKLWGLDSPTLYTLVTSVVRNDEVISKTENRFGIRSFRFDPDKGFFLNGENMKIKGVCIHHDGGLVGAAVPKDVWERRFKTLKEAGCNAIRISHNPGSDEFIDLCDEMGFLVQDEFFDEWDYPKDKRLNCWERHDDYLSRGYADQFGEYAKTDLQNIVLAHRNHPSIIQWSIGNEIEWTYASNRPATGFFDNMNWDGNYFWSPPPYSPEKIKEEYIKLSANEKPVEKTAQKLADWTREIDTTRPVIANCILPSVSFVNGYIDALDIAGFSYRRIMYDYAKENYPNKVIMGTENVCQWHEWKAVAERPFVAGIFLWTGIDHMGEVHDQWPKKTSNPGLIDQAGFKKASFHMYKSLWTDEPHVQIYTQKADLSRYVEDGSGKLVEREPGAWENLVWWWPDLMEHWNYNNNEEVIVEVYSNCEEIEVFQDGKSLGKKSLADFPDHIYRWKTKFKEGNIEAVGYINGQKASHKIQTAKEPVGIKVNIDKTTLEANSKGVAHVECQLIDEDGNPVKHINKKIRFKIDDELKNLGVDNGDPYNTQAYQSDEIVTSNGRALLIVQAKEIEGEATVTVQADGIEKSKHVITVVDME